MSAARTSTELGDLEAAAAAAEAFPRALGERVLACRDLVAVGALADSCRRRLSGTRVTFCRVSMAPGGSAPSSRGAAGEVRVEGRPQSIDEAQAWIRAARTFAGDVPLTAFSLDHLAALSGHDHLALARTARALREAGLEAVAEAPLDRFDSSEDLVEVVRAVMHGSLGVWRATVLRAAGGRERLDLVERAAFVQRETGAFRAFAPLPREDPRATPSTGYDDVRTVAVARLMCPSIPFLQVDWPLYGPKLAQVALLYGASDLDGIDPFDAADEGPRRSPREDVLRQIRSASSEPAERNGRYEILR